MNNVSIVDKMLKTYQSYYRINFSVLAMAIMLLSQLFNFSQFETGIGNIAIPYVIAMLLILLQLMNQKSLTVDWGDVLLITSLIAVSIISTIMSNVVQWGAKGYSLLACLLFYISITNTSINSRSIHHLFVLYSILVIIISLQILYQYYSGSLSTYGNRYTITVLGVVKDPNFLAAYMTPCLIYICNLCFFNANIRRLSRFLLCSLILVIFIAIFCTGSRATMLSIVIDLLIFIPLIFRKILMKQNSFIMFIGLLIIFIAVINIFLMESPLNDRMFSLDSYTSNTRLMLWRHAMNAFINNPIIGYGHLSGAYYVALYTNGRWIGTHSCFVDILTGAGILGSLLIFLVYMSMLKTKKGNTLFMFSMMVAFFVPLFFVGGYYGITFWMPMAWCKIISNCCKKEKFDNLL